MGVYYCVVNPDKQEKLVSPYAQKEWEWNGNSRNAHVVLWALWRRWNYGDRIEVVNDQCDDEWDKARYWPNVWPQVEADYLRAAPAHKEPAVIYCNECAAAVPFDLSAVTVPGQKSG